METRPNDVTDISIVALFAINNDQAFMQISLEIRSSLEIQR